MMPEQVVVALDHLLGAAARVDHVQQSCLDLREIGRGTAQPPKAAPRVHDDRREGLTNLVGDGGRKFPERREARHPPQLGLRLAQRRLRALAHRHVSNDGQHLVTAGRRHARLVLAVALRPGPSELDDDRSVPCSQPGEVIFERCGEVRRQHVAQALPEKPVRAHEELVRVRHGEVDANAISRRRT
jgi:hypothetical protein